MDPAPPDLGSSLRAARTAAGLSIRAAAEAAGVSPTTVALAERGKGQVETLAKIAEAVGVRLTLLPVEGRKPAPA